MPEIPTYTASGNIRTGPVAPPVDASVLDRPARALVGLGGTIVQTAGEIGQIVDQRKKEQELRWAGDAASQYKDELIKWEQDNQGKESIGHDYRAYADQRMAEYLKNSPNQRASLIFQRNIEPFVRTNWENNLHKGEILRFQNFETGEIKASTADNEAHRNLSSDYPEGANALRDISLNSQIARIQTAYGQTMPKQAAVMSERAVVQAVEGAMENDPAFAKELLDSHKEVDADTRRVLLNQIETQKNRINDEAAIYFNQAVRNELKTANENNVKLTPRPKSDFEVLGHGQDSGYAQYKLAVQFNNDIIGEWDKIKSDAPYYQQQHSQEMRRNGQGFLADELDRKIQQNINDIRSGNVVACLNRTNDDIARFFKPTPGATAEDQVANTRMGYEFIKHYSGPAPRDANGNLLVSEAESRKFLGLSTGQQHLLTVESANALAGELNGLGPQDLYMRVKQFPALYGNEINSAMVFNDLVTLPKEGNKLSPATQFALAMPTPELAIKYLGTVKAAKEVKVPSGTTQKDFFDELKNTNWPLFRRAFNGDNEQRRGQINDFQDAVLHYAYSLADTKNPNPKSAVRTAVDHLVDQSFGFPMVNGVPMAVLRERGPGKPNRTDEDMAEIGRTMAVSFRQFPLQQLSITDPLSRAVFPKAEFINDPVEKLQYIRDAISSRGFWVTESHGQSATVYVADESGKGTVMQLRDKTGQPFEIAFDDLPKYETQGSTFIETRGTVQEIPRTIKEQPQSTYPIAEKQHEFTPMERANLYYLFGAPTLIPGFLPKTTVRTNWPVAGPQYKRQVP